MRNKLRTIGKEERHRFTAEFGGVGYKQNYGHFAPTLLLVNVRLNDELITDHLWFNYGKQFAKLGTFEKGDQISFDGRITAYRKGYYLEETTDYKIERPTKIKRESGDGSKILPDPTTEKNALVGYVMEVNHDFYVETGRPYDAWYVDQWKAFQRKN